MAPPEESPTTSRSQDSTSPASPPSGAPGAAITQGPTQPGTTEDAKAGTGTTPVAKGRAQKGTPDRKFQNSGYLTILYMVLASLAGVLILYYGIEWGRPVLDACAISIWMGSTVLFVTAYAVDINRVKPWERLRQYLRDKRGFPSLSRLQFFLWTGIVIYAFTWVTFIRILSGVPAFTGNPATDIPPNLLAIVGISAASHLVSTQLDGRRSDVDIDGRELDFRSMVDEATKMDQVDNVTHLWYKMCPSLGRYQMLGWTAVAVGIYVAVLLQAVHQVWNGSSIGKLTLPDLDTTLVTLMGLSHGGFLGSKYISLSSK